VKLDRIPSQQEPDEELARLRDAFLLDAGEVAALCLMQENPNAILLTDDAAARLVAERLDYAVHGTIGVLLRAVRRRQRSKRQLLNLLKNLPSRSTLFIESELLAHVIEQVKKGMGP
jgi:predicted nucleic acid-binding protein